MLFRSIEKGDLYMALGRYNGSRGRPEYPRAVQTAWKRWQGSGGTATAAKPGNGPRTAM